MRKYKNGLTIVCSLLLALFAAATLDARTKKGDKHLAEGRKAEQARDWDKALEWYEKALGEDPGDGGYQIATRRARFQAATGHTDLGQKLRREGKLDEALAEFQKAYATDPSSAVAEQELKRTVEMLERNRKAAIKPEDRGLTPAEFARKEELERISRILSPPELKALSAQPINLRMSNQPPKNLFETVAKLAGINVVFDADYSQDTNSNRRFSVELNNATLDEALDYLGTMTKAYWKPLSPNTIFVTADNQTKRREHGDQAVRVFYLNNATTPQELTEIATTFRTVAEIRKLFQVNALNAIIVKGSPDEIALAEKLVNDLDKPKAEVVVDVLVMEANRSKTRDIAATIASGGTPGINAPIGFTPTNRVIQDTGDDDTDDTTTTTTTSTTSQLIRLGRIAKLSTNDFSVTLPGALLKFVMSDRATKVLQSPQVRAASGQKASLRIGDKVPVAQGGFQPMGGTTTGGYGSLYSQFQFIDVGVNVDITPFVHGDGDVTLKVMLEISSVRDRVDVGGISQPLIGQRKVEHEIRIKEGEASLLGGLMQGQDSKTTSGVPGLASIPLIKRLFSSESVERSDSELLIVLIPHIVRTPGINDVNLRSVSSGTDQYVRINRSPKPVDATTAPAPAPAAPTAQNPPAAIPGVTPAPATQPQPAQPAPAAPAPVQPAAPGIPPAAPPAAAPAEAQSSYTFAPAAVSVDSGGTFTLELRADNARDLFAAPFHLKYDPQLLKLQDVKAGPLMSADGQRIIFTRNIQNDTGDLIVNLNRMPGSGAVNGSGVLAVLTFQAAAKGRATVQFSQFGLRNSQLAPIEVQPPQAVVTVK